MLSLNEDISILGSDYNVFEFEKISSFNCAIAKK
jgi:hypothetical protein